MTKTILILAIAAAFVVGSITTATLAEAKPIKDGDGDGIMEGAVHEITGILNHATHGLETIQNAITSVQSDTTTIKSDVTDIKTETDKIASVNADIGDIKTETDKIPMIKSDVEDIKTETDKIQMLKDQISALQTQLDSTSEPLTQFKTITTGTTNDEIEKRLTIVSTGPMIVETCLTDRWDGTMFVEWFDIDTNTSFDIDIFLQPLECRSLGVNVGDGIVFRMNPNFSVDTIAKLNVRTTPSAIVTVTEIENSEP